MTTYTITVGAGSGANAGYYGYSNGDDGEAAFGSISPGGSGVTFFAWASDGSALVVYAPDADPITWNGVEYTPADLGGGLWFIYVSSPTGPFPTSGTSTFSIGGAGSGAITGTLSGTDGADAAATAGAVIVSGALSGTDGADLAFVSSGIPPVTGVIAATDGADTATISGAVLVMGSISATDGADSASVTQSVVSVGGHFPSIYIKQKRQPEKTAPRDEIRAAIDAAFEGPPLAVSAAPPAVAPSPVDPMPAIIDMIMRAQAEAQSRIDADDEDAIAILAMVDDGDRRAVMQALHAIGVI
ncbi:hypothetical protein [Xanthobacter autotrophicus]|uniref:hypothetical protein n=1 Tax=Xanthobacter autotrophicus TaxID=280 RepID=UPI00372B2004